MTTYTHLSQRNQILKKPAQHIGSINNIQRNIWLSEADSIVKKEITYNAGLVHIFYEVLSNAQDNFFVSRETETPLKRIVVNVDKETGEISVWNDGKCIPNRIHKWGKDEEVIDSTEHYEAEIIFGHLNSSSNYDENKVRIGAGTHGVGVKLTNIFSSFFSVECYDPETGLCFKQKYKENMGKAEKPKITKKKQTKGYAKISYIADFRRFNVDGYSDEHISVIRKLCIDCAMITEQTVLFNGEKLGPIKKFSRYVQYYTVVAATNQVELKSKDSTIVLCEKEEFEPGFSQISFVNGIVTEYGGVHVDEWKKAIFKEILERLNKKYSSKSVHFTVKTLENYFLMFVKCNLNNPEFEGQTKGILCSPKPTIEIQESKISAILRWSFMENIEEMVRLQGMKELKKTDGRKKSSIDIPKADDANKASSSQSLKCTLFITEGDSAKAFATKGISTIKDGTNWYGILPVRGKVLNVRKHTSTQINANEEITNLKKILGLRHGVDYSDEKEYSTLRYGCVCILTDADPDGDHIKGLIINFFQYFFSSLLSRNFIKTIRTPIVKATSGKNIFNFYYIKDFKKWAVESADKQRKYEAKYYKGLGTSTDSEIYEIFSNPKNVEYITDIKTVEAVEMIFGKNADERKKWLENYVETEFKYNEKNGREMVKISEFFNNEMINFSIYDNKRSIPNVIDGLKPSQRKGLWAGLKKLNKEFKVAQFSAEVAGLSQYHHGESSMEQTIIGMAQTFVGSNNIALFEGIGQFGTRNMGGQDASASRYIFVNMSPIARKIFRKEDDPLLDYIEDEGKKIEPRFYVPIIPMILVNGCKGIGTGYSTNIPTYNPIDLVRWIKNWLTKKPTAEIKPWCWEFKGEIEQTKEKIIYSGRLNETGQNVYEITELPVGMWTDNYKAVLNVLKTGQKENSGYGKMTVKQLKDLLSENGLSTSGVKKTLIKRLQVALGNATSRGGKSIVKKWEWHGDAYNVNFKVWSQQKLRIKDPKLKLFTMESLLNMTAFTENGGIKKYGGVEEIMATFCSVRYKFYETRKDYLVQVLNEKSKELKSKAKFIKRVLENVSLLKKTENDLFKYFEENNFWRKKGDFSYLTDMAVRSFTRDKYRDLIKQIKDILDEIERLKNKTPRKMWEEELAEFLEAYEKWKSDTLQKNISTIVKRKRKL